MNQVDSYTSNGVWYHVGKGENVPIWAIILIACASAILGVALCVLGYMYMTGKLVLPAWIVARKDKAFDPLVEH